MDRPATGGAIVDGSAIALPVGDGVLTCAALIVGVPAVCGLGAALTVAAADKARRAGRDVVGAGAVLAAGAGARVAVPFGAVGVGLALARAGIGTALAVAAADVAGDAIDDKESARAAFAGRPGTRIGVRIDAVAVLGALGGTLSFGILLRDAGLMIL